MLKLLTTLVFLFIASLSQADDGFRGVKWGTPPEQFVNLKTKKAWLNVDEFAYRKIKEDMFVGDAKVTDIIYIFWENKFHQVIITSEEPTKLYKSCESKWGSPKEIRGYRFRWLPNDGDNEIFLYMNPIKEEARLTIQSDSIDRIMSQPRGSVKGF